jgi:ABC-2 type transport system ATP-binding protein
MSELEQSRSVRVRFARPPEGVPELAGLRQSTQKNGRLSLEYAGPLPPLLEWLARQAVEDLRIEPLGLAPIYHRYHGAEE